MNAHRYFQRIVLLLIGAMSAACSSMNSLTIPVTQPAPVHVPSSIQHVAIINRSMPSEENDSMDKIDKILSVEGIKLDEEAASSSISGLYEELCMSERFESVIIIEDAVLENPGMGVFPAPIPWKLVNDICEEHHVDALFVLSYYDTDTKVDYNVVPVKIEGPLGVNLPAVEHHAKAATNVKAGWRIYDPGRQYILDEFPVNKHLEVAGSGINPVNAAKAIVQGRKENILNTSRQIGEEYTLRIFPYRMRVRREYYVKGTENFEIAKRRAQTGDWKGAAKLWEEEVNNSKGKLAGRAYYNMAIINEIDGDLGSAVDWASKSYSDYNNKEALDYVNVLKDRMHREAVLQAQMSE